MKPITLKPSKEKAMFTLNGRDKQVMTTLIDLRVATADQITAIRGGNAEAITKRLHALQSQRWISSKPRNSTGKRGRPERVFSLTEQGLQFLAENEAIAADVLKQPGIQVMPPASVDHCLLMNWVLIHAMKLGQKSCLKADCLSSASVLPNHRNGKPILLRDHAALPELEKPKAFTPDLVLCLQHAELAKSVLFFMEVDLGTEELRSSLTDDNSIATKMRCYQAYFAQNGYTRYGQTWNTAFRGFRLLVVTNTHSRLVDLCRFLVAPELGPVDFVWMTDFDSLTSKGIHEKIWIRGGRDDRERQSILGSQLQRFVNDVDAAESTAKPSTHRQRFGRTKDRSRKPSGVV